MEKRKKNTKQKLLLSSYLIKAKIKLFIREAHNKWNGVNLIITYCY